MTRQIKLAIVGDRISSTKAPQLHRAAGNLSGIDVIYDLLVPRDMGLSFDEVFAYTQANGFDGINVTSPYKEQVAVNVGVSDPKVEAIAAVNTVVFGEDGPQGFNTDYSGFMTAYRAQFGKKKPGTVVLIGAGGVGRAIGFALMKLGARVIRVIDTDVDKAKGLARCLTMQRSGVRVEIYSDPTAAALGAHGIINCTPLGMEGIGGSPVDPEAFHGSVWAMDAIYTPIRTQFIEDADAARLKVITGYELFLAQCAEAWRLFSGVEVDPEDLREALRD